MYNTEIVCVMVQKKKNKKNKTNSKMIRFLNQMIMQINPSDEAMKRMASRKCDSY